MSGVMSRIKKIKGDVSAHNYRFDISRLIAKFMTTWASSEVCSRNVEREKK